MQSVHIPPSRRRPRKTGRRGLTRIGIQLCVHCQKTPTRSAGRDSSLCSGLPLTSLLRLPSFLATLGILLFPLLLLLWCLGWWGTRRGRGRVVSRRPSGGGTILISICNISAFLVFHFPPSLFQFHLHFLLLDLRSRQQLQGTRNCASLCRLDPLLSLPFRELFTQPQYGCFDCRFVFGRDAGKEFDCCCCGTTEGSDCCCSVVCLLILFLKLCRFGPFNRLLKATDRPVNQGGDLGGGKTSSD
mmetsp:Transcript_39327/g.77373  ORF Transcript_39327/g.77373 Transcript_39327/m.77373 type:complete len:244 (+) Transcript_39327:304-1035(+)